MVNLLAGQARRWSPYTYGNDNPLIFTDPDGMSSSHFEGQAAQDEFQKEQQAQGDKDKKRGISESPNVLAAEARQLAMDAFDPSKPRASGRVENDYTLESFGIPFERGITLLRSGWGVLGKFFKFGREEVVEAAATKGGIQLTAHGSERIAGARATRGDTEPLTS